MPICISINSLLSACLLALLVLAASAEESQYPDCPQSNPSDSIAFQLYISAGLVFLMRSHHFPFAFLSTACFLLFC
jgi:hypothetical protein